VIPEVREKGILNVTKSKKGFSGNVKINDKVVSLSSYHFEDDSLNGKECEVEREKGVVKKLFVDGREYPMGSSAGNTKVGKVIRQGIDQGRQQSSGGHGTQNKIVDIWSADNTKLPKDTRGLIKEQQDVENFCLLLNKAAQFVEYERSEGFSFFIQKKPSGREEGKRLRVEPNGYGGMDFRALSHKIDNVRLSASQFELVKIGDLEPVWRMVVGLGGESVYETSMTLHHIYGFPYIPGSAIKGITRHFIISNLLSGFLPEENLAVLDKAIDLPELEKLRTGNNELGVEKSIKALRDGLKVKRDNEEIRPSKALLDLLCKGWEELDKTREVFGNQARRGKVIFLDAYPVKPPAIKADIMNPHYSDYYTKKKAPVDHMNPVPIHFLTVERTPFSFAVMAEKRDREVLEMPIGGRKISEWVRAALSEHGIGAKTAIGYGFFKDSER